MKELQVQKFRDTVYRLGILGSSFARAQPLLYEIAEKCDFLEEVGTQNLRTFSIPLNLWPGTCWDNLSMGTSPPFSCS